MTAPSIESSTREERLNYVLNEWKCLHNCELCGKCHVLKGSSGTYNHLPTGCQYPSQYHIMQTGVFAYWYWSGCSYQLQ